MSSYLPEKIYLYAKKPQGAQVIDRDDDEDEYDDEDIPEGVRHAFPVSDQSSQSRHENAERWSQTTTYPNGYNKPPKTEKGDLFEYPNSGFGNVTIKNLEIRGQGGRAYQVILEHDGKKFQVDLREDALMDVIRNTGIEAGGRLNGTFCFIVEGSQTNLVREHSKVWEGARKGAESRKNTTLKKSDLKIGHQYRSLSGDTVVYLGEAFTRTVTIKEDQNASYYRRGGTGKLEYGKVAKKMIFIDAWDGKSAIEAFKNGETARYNIKFQTSHSYREDLGKVGDIDSAQIVPLLNSLGENHYKEAIKNDYYASYVLEAVQLIEASEKKDIKEEKDKINKAMEMYVAYNKKQNRW